jgi:hypothetical protein
MGHIGFDSRTSRDLSPCHRLQTGSGTQSASDPVGTRCSYPGVKRMERKADHLSPSGAEVNNAWSYSSTPLWYGTVVPEDVRGSKCLVPHILDLGTSWRCQLQGSPLYPSYPLDRRLGGPHTRSVRRGEEKNLASSGTQTQTPQPSSP